MNVNFISLCDTENRKCPGSGSQEGTTVDLRKEWKEKNARVCILYGHETFSTALSVFAFLVRNLGCVVKSVVGRTRIKRKKMRSLTTTQADHPAERRPPLLSWPGSLVHHAKLPLPRGLSTVSCEPRHADTVQYKAEHGNLHRPQLEREERLSPWFSLARIFPKLERTFYW